MNCPLAFCWTLLVGETASEELLTWLQALSFVFEYIGEMGKDYIYAVTPLLEDALMDRDMVHRQTACAVVKRTFSSNSCIFLLFMFSMFLTV